MQSNLISYEDFIQNLKIYVATILIFGKILNTFRVYSLNFKFKYSQSKIKFLIKIITLKNFNYFTGELTKYQNKLKYYTTSGK